MNWNFWSPLFIGFALGFNSFNLIIHVGDHTYRDGQIDAIRGEVKYELKVQEDGTTKWEYIK